MNKQRDGKGIEWTQVINQDGTKRNGYTWNVSGGCFHDCKWEMPNGTIAECYAKVQAESEQLKPFYPHGFKHHYWHEHRLEEPLKVKKPAGIFLDSMSDLMGHWVADDHIHAVLDICQQASQHIFFLLTKNPKRLLNFDFPDNVWVGASSPPDYYKGSYLNSSQKNTFMSFTLQTLGKVDANVKWISFEPLSHDYSALVNAFHTSINWAVIGAASYKRQYIPPATDDFISMMAVLDSRNVPVFFKGNLKSLPEAVADWREEFPTISNQQLTLF